MPDYDFIGLGPSDFEAVSHDLLQEALSVKLQGFTSGRDRGIDLRHAPIMGRDWIVQCKHYARSGYSALLSHMKRKELPKIRELRPGRYIFATSVGLSPSNVDELFEVLSPFCLSKHDIFGRDDLNALLRLHPGIEQSHFRLWLTSEAVLSKVLHNDVFVQSCLTEEQIRQRLSLYVHTASFEMAREKLAEDHVCILSGVPGIGKTTTAEMLIVEYLMDEWQLIAIHQNVAEAQRVFKQDAKAKQVFYYDDFLGQISTGEKLGKNEDRALLQLMASIARSRNKRFILTTREYILAQAKAEHELLSRSGIDLYRFVIKCEDYSDVDKARILANHLYFALVPQEHIASLVEGGEYRKVISHRNYSPRVIEWMTNVSTISACPPAKYAKVFLEGLDNPSDLWRHPFENQLSEASRHLLLVLASCGDGILLTDLREAFNSFYRYRATRYGFVALPSSFDRSLNELEGNFVRIDRSGDSMVVSFHNPSILDFLSQRFRQHRDDIGEILQCAVFFEQIERLLRVFHASGSPVKRSKTGSGIDAKVVEVAIERTLLARRIGLFRGKGQWHNVWSSVWTRLRTCCWIGSQFTDRELRTLILEHVEVQMATVDRRSGETAEITRVLESVAECDWCDKKLVSRWNEMLFQSVCAMNDDLEENLEGLAAAANWFVENREQFDEKQGAIFVEKLSTCVTREAESQSAEQEDPERLSSDLEAVQGIGEALGRSFAQEEDWLNEAISERQSKGDRDDGESWREHHPQSCQTSIESIFEALLE